MDFVNIYATKPVISRYETDLENPTIFHVGVLPAAVRAALEDAQTRIETSSKNPNEKALVTINIKQHRLLALRFGLKGIDNGVDPRNQKPVEFSTVSYSLKGKNYNIVTEEIVDMIHPKVQEELTEIILGESNLSEAEEKN